MDGIQALLAKIQQSNPELFAQLRDTEGFDTFNETMEVSCEQAFPEMLQCSTPLLFPEDAQPGEFVYDESLHNTVVKTLSAEYSFKESPAKLNISDKRHEMYEAVEKSGGEPLYVVVEMPSGFSRRLSEDTINRNDSKPKKEDIHRFWSPEVMWGFAEQIRARRPVGYMGHATMWDFSTIPENIPVQWETAVKATRKSDGVAVTLVRGYIYDSGMNRTYIRTGAINSASVFAIGKSELDETDKRNPVVRITSAALISFDFVRKNTHGLPGTRVVAGMQISFEEQVMFTAEQLKLIGSLTAEQLKECHPALYHELTKANSAASQDVSELVAQLQKLQKANVEYQFDAERARGAAKALGCSTEELVAHVEEIRAATISRVTEQIKTCTNKLKSERLRTMVSKQLTELNLSDPEKVNAKFQEFVAIHVELSREIGSEIPDLTEVLSDSGRKTVATEGAPYVADWLEE